MEAKQSQIDALRGLIEEARAASPEYQTQLAAKLLNEAKKAANKRVTDLENAIAKREKIEREQAAAPADAELTATRERIKALNEEYKKLFPPNRSVLSEEALLGLRTKALDRQIADLEADLAAGRLGSKAKGTPPTSPELEAKQARLTELREAREEARAVDLTYQAEQEVKRTDRYKKTLERRLAFWNKVAADAKQGKLPEKRKPTPVDRAIEDKKYEIELAKREADAVIEEAVREKRKTHEKVLGFGGDLLDLQFAVMTTGEFSYFGRQGLLYSLGFPLRASRALVKSVTAALSRRADFAIHQELWDDSNHPDQVRGGLVTTVSDGPLSKREEGVRSRLASQLAKGPAWSPLRWAAEGMMGFERAFRTFMNIMRSDLFNYMKDSVESSRPGTWSEDDAKTIANASNVFSGRTKDGLTSGWGRVFFAPEWIWSTVKMVAGQPLWSGDRATRLAIGKVYVRAMLGYAAMKLIKHVIHTLLADDEKHKPRYELDWRSSDLGKTIIGDTRLDDGRGLSQLAVLAGRIWTGETKLSSGKIVKVRGEDGEVRPGTDDLRDIMHRFVDSKLAPLPSAVIDFIVGKNVVGKKVTLGSIIKERTMPMTWRDIWEAEKELGVAQGTVAALDAYLGTGISTYGLKSEYRDASPEEREKIDESLMRTADLLVRAKPLDAVKGEVWEEDQAAAYNRLKSIGRTPEQLIREYRAYLNKEIQTEELREPKARRFAQRLNMYEEAAKAENP